MSTPPTQVIYPAQSVITLLSRAWNLYRANFKNSVIIMLPPILLLSLIHLLTGILSSGTFLTPTSVADMGYKLLITGFSLLFLIPAFFVWMYSSCALSRLYFSAIVGDVPLDKKACWAYITKNWLNLTLLAMVLGFISFILIVISFIVLYLGIFLSVALMAFLGVSLPHLGSNLATGAMLVLFLLVWGFAVLAAVVSMISFQGFFFAFPMLAVSTATYSKMPWWPLIKHAYKLLFENIPRLILFAVTLFFLSLAIMSVLMTPIWVWVAIEFTRLGVNQQHHLPMHMTVVINIWSTVVNLVMYPFHISALSLLWYDCQVRHEGLDLRIWFNQLIRRQGKQPEEFNTVIDPQPA